MELEEKFLVLKRADIEAALTYKEQEQFAMLCRLIAFYRRNVLDKPENRYVVINQDEPYFPDVLKLMEKNELDKAQC